MSNVVYLTSANTGTAIPSFTERGIGHLMPGELDDVHLIIDSDENNKVYPAAVADIHLYCHAQLTGVPFLAQAKDKYKNVFKTIRNLVQTYDVPVLYLVVNEITEEDKETLKSMGMTEFTTRKNAWTGTPSCEAITWINKLRPVDVRPPMGYVSYMSYMTWQQALRGVEIFSISSRAFGCTNFVNYLVMSERVEEWNKDDSDHKYKMYSLGSDKPTELKKVLTNDKSKLVHSAPATVYTGWSGTKKIIGISSDIRSNDLPLVDGIFFPYFDGMTTPDKTVFQHVFASTFLRCIGDNIDQATRIWTIMKKAFRDMAWSPAGRIISHLYYGIDLAKRTNAIFTPSHDGGRYAGFFLQATGLVVKIYGREFLALDSVEMAKSSLTTSIHSDALEGIRIRFNSALDAEGNHIFKLVIEDINTSTKLRALLFRTNPAIFAGTDNWKEIGKLVEKLTFGDKFPIPNVTTLTIFLNFVRSGDVGLISEHPSYLLSGTFSSKSRITVGLSIFGPRVPSLSYGNKKKEHMELSMPIDLLKEDPLLGKGADNKRKLPYLPFAIMPIIQASTQWEDVFNTGSIILPPPKKGRSEFTSSAAVQFKINGDPVFTNTYNLVKQISSEARKLKQIGKRALGKDGETAAVKRSRKEAKDMEDLF